MCQLVSWENGPVCVVLLLLTEGETDSNDFFFLYQNSNNGHMIKFEFFETETSYQCHFSEIGTFVVSIAHYMRAYFNYQALSYGADFKLPSDVGYLNVRGLQRRSMFATSRARPDSHHSSSLQKYSASNCKKRPIRTSRCMPKLVVWNVKPLLRPN